MNLLRKKYFNALNARQRVEEKTFLQDLKFVRDIGKLYFGKFTFNLKKAKVIVFYLKEAFI